MKLSIADALKQVEEELLKLSGYPDHTVTDPALAFAYGLTIGTVMKERDEWKRKEEKNGDD